MHIAIATRESPMPASLRLTGAEDDSYRIWIDGPVLRIDDRGDWDVAIARAYIADVTRLIDAVRRRQPYLRVIVDRSAMPTRSEGARQLMLRAAQDILRDGDRVAMVVGSSLAKAQMRQTVGRDARQSFLSISAARTWVLAYG